MNGIIGKSIDVHSEAKCYHVKIGTADDCYKPFSKMKRICTGMGRTIQSGNIKLTATNRIILDLYRCLLDRLADYIGTGFEFVLHSLEDHVKLFMALPEMNACTDGLLAPGKPHPRFYGSFPRILGKYVREEKIMSIEDAIKKMTSKAAEAMKLKDRGLLKEGYFARALFLSNYKRAVIEG